MNNPGLKQINSKIFQTSLLCAAAIAVTIPKSSMAQNFTPPPIVNSQMTEKQAAEIKTWQMRIEGLLENIKDEMADQIVNDKMLAETDLTKLLINVIAVQGENIGGDAIKLASRYSEEADRQSSARHRILSKLFQDLLYPSSEIGKYSESTEAKIEELSTHNDLIISIVASGLASYRNLREGDATIAPLSETVRLLIPPQTDKDYLFARYMMAELKEMESAVAMDAEKTYQHILEKQELQKKAGWTRNGLTGIQNLLNILAAQYGRDHFKEQARRIIDIDYGDDQFNATNLILFAYGFAEIGDPERQKILQKALDLTERRSYLSEYAMHGMLLEAMYSGDHATVVKHKKFITDSSGTAHINLKLTYDILYTQKDEAQVLKETYIRRLKVLKERRQRAGKTQQIIRSLSAIQNEETLSAATTKGNILFNNYDTTAKLKTLKNADAFRIKSINKKIFAVNSLSKTQGDQILAFADLYFSGSLKFDGTLSNLENRIDLDIINPETESYNQSVSGSQSSLSLAKVRHQYPNIYQRTIADRSYKPTDFERAYSQLIAMNNKIRSGDYIEGWNILTEIKETPNLSNLQRRHLSFDIKQTELSLIFIEGDIDLLMKATEEVIEEAILLRRKINAVEMLTQLAVTLQSHGYYQETLLLSETVSINIEMGNVPEYLPILLRARAQSQTNETHNTLMRLKRLIENSSHVADEVILLNDALKAANAKTDINAITHLRAKLLNILQSVESVDTYQEARPTILQSNYILAKDAGDPSSDKLYGNYQTAISNRIRIGIGQQSKLRDIRMDAQDRAFQANYEKLSVAQTQTSKQSDIIKLLASLLLVIFSFCGLALYQASRVSRKSAKETTQNTINNRRLNRTIKDGHWHSKRFIESSIKLIEKARKNTLDMQVIDTLDDLENDLRTYETENSKSSFKARNSIGQEQALLQTVDMKELVRTQALYWKGQVPGNNIAITFDCDRKIPPLVTDPHFLEVILIEMIEHSLQHTLYGAIYVTYEYREDAKKLSITVMDTGDGRQNITKDYHLAQEAVAELGGKFKMLKRKGFAKTVQAVLPVAIGITTSSTLIENSNVIENDFENVTAAAGNGIDQTNVISLHEQQ